MRHTYLYTKIGEYSGFGGPAVESRADPRYPATPTRAGRFTIVSIGKHVTLRDDEDARIWSAVPWDTPVRVKTTATTQVRLNNEWHSLSSKPGKSVVEIRLPGHDWQPLTNLPAWRRYAHRQDYVYRKVSEANVMLWAPVLNAYKGSSQQLPIQFYKVIPERWVFNDFGHATIKYYRDVNHNGRQDAVEAERTLSDFIHATPAYELFYLLNEQVNAGINAPLGESHGCVHAFPADIDDMVRARYLSIGGTFVVHSYTTRIEPVFQQTTTEVRMQKQEVHFFPREKKFIVYMVTTLS